MINREGTGTMLCELLQSMLSITGILNLRCKVPWVAPKKRYEDAFVAEDVVKLVANYPLLAGFKEIRINLTAIILQARRLLKL